MIVFIKYGVCVVIFCGFLLIAAIDVRCHKAKPQRGRVALLYDKYCACTDVTPKVLWVVCRAHPPRLAIGP